MDVKGDSLNTIPDSLRDKSNLSSESDKDALEEITIRNILEDYGLYIHKYSKRYGFDWRLVLSIIKQESNFSTYAESHKGALGLMQIMPQTGKSLADELDLEEVISPRNNIAAGIYYLWKLSESFHYAEGNNKLKLTLAAYNCGISRVQDAQDIVRYYKGNPYDWNSVAEALKKLSKDNSNLHLKVWDIDRPPAGYFDNSNQPIAYVESVLKYYNTFQIKLAYK
jgi:membrane-bound lytic murein transglycosylase F